jgi:hypothetical protein
LKTTAGELYAIVPPVFADQWSLYEVDAVRKVSAETLEWFASCMCSGQSWTPAGIVCTARVWAEAFGANDTADAASIAEPDSSAPAAPTKRRLLVVLKTPFLSRHTPKTPVR